MKNVQNFSALGNIMITFCIEYKKGLIKDGISLAGSVIHKPNWFRISLGPVYRGFYEGNFPNELSGASDSV